VDPPQEGAEKYDTRTAAELELEGAAWAAMAVCAPPRPAGRRRRRRRAHGIRRRRPSHPGSVHAPPPPPPLGVISSPPAPLRPRTPTLPVLRGADATSPPCAAMRVCHRPGRAAEAGRPCCRLGCPTAAGSAQVREEEGEEEEGRVCRHRESPLLGRSRVGDCCGSIAAAAGRRDLCSAWSKHQPAFACAGPAPRSGATGPG
jgi:hypothetical protein